MITLEKGETREYDSFSDEISGFEEVLFRHITVECLRLKESFFTIDTPLSGYSGWWNTRNVMFHFNILKMLSTEERWNRCTGWFGWDDKELDSNIQWLEDLIQNFHARRERAHLW